MTRYAIAIEKAGIPTAIISYPRFLLTIRNLAEFDGMPDLRVVVRPGETRPPGRDLYWDTFSGEELIEELADALTKPEWVTPESEWLTEALAGVGPAPTGELPTTFTGATIGEATEAFNKEFIKRRLTDGLPVVPPTEERIEWMLTGTDLSPDYSFGVIQHRQGEATVRTIAINAVMAGARPEYLPVILAMVECIVDPRFFYTGCSTTANRGGEMVVILGPVAQKLGVYSGTGCLGPGWRPNYTIGRTLRLIAITVGGVWPGINKMSPILEPGRGGCWTLGESEDIPPGWEPLQVDLGYSRETSIVLVMFCDQGYPAGSDTDSFAETIAVKSGSHNRSSDRGDRLLMISPDIAASLAQQGYSRISIQEETYAKAAEFTPAYATMDPKGLVILVTSGGSYFLGGWGLSGQRMVSKEIDKYIPKNWAALLEEAEK